MLRRGVDTLQRPKFVPPVRVQKESVVETTSSASKRISDDVTLSDARVRSKKFRTPLMSSARDNVSSNEESKTESPSKSPETITPSGSKPSPETRSYSVLWRKVTSKKHKSWDGDGYIKLNGISAVLHDTNGKVIGQMLFKLFDLESGTILTFSGKDVEIEAPMDINPSTQPNNTTTKPKCALKPFSMPVPLNSKKLIKEAKAKIRVQPRHNPGAEGVVVLASPQPIPAGYYNVSVVIDPLLSLHLRPHQIAGVEFLYRCVVLNGLEDGKAHLSQGCILADEMGLGKTLQVITLAWTLLKQNPLAREDRESQPGRSSIIPLAKRILIVCPVTLISNWRKEIRKWLGSERVGVFVVDSNTNNVRDFNSGNVYSIMIIGYEKVRLLQEDLRTINFDLIVCDEGHRLKSAQNKSAQAIKSFNCKRRIILTGTPMQNDLGEFFVMVDFVNPGLLTNYGTFKKVYEIPIMKSRQPLSTKKDLETGKEQSEALSKITSPFILRRTAQLLSQYLHAKTEYVVFCRPTKVQLIVSNAFLTSSIVSEALRSSETAIHLRAILSLRKIANAPQLFFNSMDSEEKTDRQMLELRSNLQKRSDQNSGKLKFLLQLLSKLRSDTEEKVVIVSNFTQTLDLIQGAVSSSGWAWLRLDGQTSTTMRQTIVDKFNRGSAQSSFIFLLSSKSGGCGLNLVGGSRLVLYDSDWNPSNDLQAMARIHRDGQKRPVFIYRLLTTGTIDEKIYQRQMTKLSLSDSFMDGRSDSASNTFTLDVLRDLFTIDSKTSCASHDLLNCQCGGTGEQALISASEEPSEDENDLGWIKASEIDTKTYNARAKPRLDRLNLYRHFDPEHIRRERAILAESSPSAVNSTTVIATADEETDEEFQTLHNYDILSSPTAKVTTTTARITDELLAKTIREDTSNLVSYVFAQQ